MTFLTSNIIVMTKQRVPCCQWWYQCYYYDQKIVFHCVCAIWKEKKNKKGKAADL